MKNKNVEYTKITFRLEKTLSNNLHIQAIKENCALSELIIKYLKKGLKGKK